MAQNALQLLWAYALLTLDCLLQRYINWSAAKGVPYFDQSGTKLLEGKTVVVTGANTGLGLETARWLIANGAEVVLACRSKVRGGVAAADLRAMSADARVSVQQLDLADLDNVRAFAERMQAFPIDILVLNAGVMRARELVRGEEPHMAINHAAHALLLLLMAPALRACGGRAVCISSYASVASNLTRGSFDASWFTAYANSKLAQLLFARALVKRAPTLPIICVHPGESTTDVTRNLGRMWMWLHHNIGSTLLLAPRVAARTSVYAAAAPLDDPVLQQARGGVLLHAIRHTIVLPEHLLNDEDADWMWDATLDKIGMSESDAMALLDAPGANTNKKQLKL